MKHLNFNLYNLNSYSPLLYKIVTLHTQIYNKQNNLHVREPRSQLPVTVLVRVLCHPLFPERGTVLLFYGFLVTVVSWYDELHFPSS